MFSVFAKNTTITIISCIGLFAVMLGIKPQGDDSKILFAATSEIKLQGDDHKMKWYDYINEAHHGRYVTKVDGQIIMGSRGSGLIYFPESLANAQKNWNHSVPESWKNESDEYEFYNKDEELETAETSFGIFISFLKENGKFDEFAHDKSSIFAYRNTLYMFSDFSVQKISLDLETVKKEAKERRNANKWRIYEYHIRKEALDVVRAFICPIDIVQVGNYLYYIEGGKTPEKSDSTIWSWTRIPFELRSFDMETGEMKILYRSKCITSLSSTELISDGDNIYFYAPRNEKNDSELIGIRYSIKDNKIYEDNSMIKPNMKEVALAGRHWKIETAAKKTVIKKHASAKAWKVIEEYFENEFLNWYVEQDAIYFIILEYPEVIFKKIDLASGKVSDAVRLSDEDGFISAETLTTLFADLKINTMDQYRFELHTYNGTNINPMKGNTDKKGYHLWWGLFYDKP